MIRYETRRPRASWCDDDVVLESEMPETVTVVEEQDDGFTGLYDAKGLPLYRIKPPMGFVG